MAFSFTVTERLPGQGSKSRVYGTYTNAGGSTGGPIATGMSQVNSVTLQPTGASALALVPSVNATFPVTNATGAVTIVTNANETGIWEAWGII